MKILQVITLSELGGAQSVVINLANKLSIEHEVIVAAGAGDGKMWELLSKNITQEHIPSLVRELSPLKEIKTMIALRMIYRKFHPDIIHLHSSKAGLLGRIVFPRRKIVYTVHGFDSIRLAHRKFLPLERILQKRCSAIVGVSHYDKNNLIKEGITNNVSVVYNGIAKPIHLESSDPFQSLATKPRVLCIARLSPPKNHDLFLQIAKLLPEINFIWIGNLEEPTFEIPQNVFFMGNIPNAGSYIEYANLLILPSNYEGLPMVIIEAMAMSKPVIASNVGGISEIVRYNVNGYTLNNQADLFAEKIKLLLNKKDMYNDFCNASYLTYQSALTVEKMVEGYLAIYNNIQNSL